MQINKKLIKAHEKGLKPILCSGESLELRESNKYKEFIKYGIGGGITTILHILLFAFLTFIGIKYLPQLQWYLVVES